MESTREADHSRMLRKAQKIRERLGGSMNMLEPFPAKPRGMHWTTYIRLYRLGNAYELNSFRMAAVALRFSPYDDETEDARGCDE